MKPAHGSLIGNAGPYLLVSATLANVAQIDWLYMWRINQGGQFGPVGH